MLCIPVVGYRVGVSVYTKLHSEGHGLGSACESGDSLTLGSSLEAAWKCCRKPAADLGSRLVLWDIHQRRPLDYGFKSIESLY